MRQYISARRYIKRKIPRFFFCTTFDKSFLKYPSYVKQRTCGYSIKIIPTKIYIIFMKSDDVRIDIIKKTLSIRTNFIVTNRRFNSIDSALQLRYIADRLFTVSYNDFIKLKLRHDIHEWSE